MICILSLFVFSVLGIFSAKYRSLAKEAFRCVFLRVQFKPCDTSLDQRLKGQIVSKLLKRNQKMARVVYKHFEAISWAFTILFFASMIYTAYAFYNLFVYGSCDPGSETCIFDMGEPVCGCVGKCQCSEEVCSSPEYEACEGDCNCQVGVCEAHS